MTGGGRVPGSGSLLSLPRTGSLLPAPGIKSKSVRLWHAAQDHSNPPGQGTRREGNWQGCSCPAPWLPCAAGTPDGKPCTHLAVWRNPVLCRAADPAEEVSGMPLPLGKAETVVPGKDPSHQNPVPILASH
uniref:Uncharacterized protein n=1 Tax=Pipistrellus kuhlii TaxID=59472 RepID=A0A7J8A9M4_PIPKU|nr:hypothetical protein mPipKuh1_009024 [Pipistrellus kuhlii]